MSEFYSVMKFGGTSVDTIKEVTSIVGMEAQKAQPIMVVSAYSGQTNELLKLADTILSDPQYWDEPTFVAQFDPIITYTLQKAEEQLGDAIVNRSEFIASLRTYLIGYICYVANQICPVLDLHQFHPTPSEVKTYVIDKIIGIGEIFSSRVLAYVMTVRNEVGSVFEDVSLANLLPKTDNHVPVLQEEKDAFFHQLSSAIAQKISSVLQRGHIPVVSGYIGDVPGGILKTIDRGYTDSTAALTAVALLHLGIHARSIRAQIWKEVPGLLSADPRIVEPNYDPKTHRRAQDFKVVKLRERATMTEAAELADLGGMKAVNPNAIWILDGKDVELQVRSTFDPESPGTTITDEVSPDLQGVRFISGKKGSAMYRVKSHKMVEQSGVADKIFSAAAEIGLSVDMITTSATSVVFSFDGKHPRRHELERKLLDIGNVRSYENMALVCCVGSNLEDSVGLLASTAGRLAKKGINIYFDGGDAESNLTFAVKEEQFEEAQRALHEGVV